MLPLDTFEIEVLGETVPPEDISGSLPPTEELVLGVTRVGEVGATAGLSELACPSLMMAPVPQGVSSGLSLLLRRETTR